MSEDAQSAIVYMGEMAHPVCSQACDNLPGFWHMSTMDDLALVWEEVTIPNAFTWVQYKVASTVDNNLHAYTYMRSYSGYSLHLTTDTPTEALGCYCAAHELPKVEYSICSHGNYNSFLGCCDEKVSQGWYPLEVNPYNYDYGDVYGQAFWRWAVE